MARARKYIEWMGAAHVFPCAGPPCFLDDDLWSLNDFDRDETNIFPDQPVFLELLAEHGVDRGDLIVPGSKITLDAGSCTVEHPSAVAATAPFADKRAYLEQYRADWQERLAAERAGWSTRSHDIVGELKPWIEPLLTLAPITSAGIAGNVVFDFDGGDGVVIDFVESEVRAWAGDAAVYHVRVDRRLIEACIEQHLEDWVNSLFLSCRFTAIRSGTFNEFVMTFFKALSVERITFVEQHYANARRDEEFIELDGWRIERYCPHRQADLTRFGTIEDGRLTCSLHHWQFDLETGQCLTSDDHRLRCSRAELDDA
jgi:UDP-MurNAc hydroxylase